MIFTTEKNNTVCAADMRTLAETHGDVESSKERWDQLMRAIVNSAIAGKTDLKWERFTGDWTPCMSVDSPLPAAPWPNAVEIEKLRLLGYGIEQDIFRGSGNSDNGSVSVRVSW